MLELFILGAVLTVWGRHEHNKSNNVVEGWDREAPIQSARPSNSLAIRSNSSSRS